MEPIVLALLIIALCYVALFTIQVLIRRSKVESIMKSFYSGIAFFGITFLACRIVFLVNDAFFLNDLSAIQIYNILYLVGNFLATIAAFGIMYSVEKYIYKKFKFIPSIIILIFSALIFIFPGPDNEYVIYYSVGGALMGAIIPFLYIYVGMKSSGEMRTKSYLTALGLIVFMVAVLFYADIVQQLIPLFAYISPIMMMGGLAIFQYALLFYSKD